MMIWPKFTLSKPRKAGDVEPDLKPLSGQNNIQPTFVVLNQGSQLPSDNFELPSRADGGPNTPPVPPIPPPHPQLFSTSGPYTRSQSMEPSRLSGSSLGVDVVSIAPSSAQSRSRSHSGVTHIERRAQSVEPEPPKNQDQYLQIRTSPSRSRSGTRRLEWVQTRRSNSTSQARSRSRGRAVVRDRIIEIVEPEETRPAAPSPRLFVDHQEPTVFDPSIHAEEDYYSPDSQPISYQKIVLEKPLCRSEAGISRSSSISTRGESTSTANSSLRSNKSTSRRSIHNIFSLERKTSRIVSIPRSSGYYETDKALVQTSKGCEAKPSKPSSYSDSGLRVASTSKIKYRYTPPSEKESPLRAYNHLKALKAFEDDVDEVQDEDRKLRRILRVENHACARSRSRLARQTVSVLEN